VRTRANAGGCTFNSYFPRLGDLSEKCKSALSDPLPVASRRDLPAKRGGVFG